MTEEMDRSRFSPMDSVLDPMNTASTALPEEIAALIRAADRTRTASDRELSELDERIYDWLGQIITRVGICYRTATAAFRDDLGESLQWIDPLSKYAFWIQELCVAKMQVLAEYRRRQGGTQSPGESMERLNSLSDRHPSLSILAVAQGNSQPAAELQTRLWEIGDAWGELRRLLKGRLWEARTRTARGEYGPAQQLIASLHDEAYQLQQLSGMLKLLLAELIQRERGGEGGPGDG
jgi:hypothetical protein